MAHLIDKDAVVAEIEKRKAINEKSYVQAFLNSNDNRDSFGYKVEEDLNILSFLDTIEVKEVDLEKEIETYFKGFGKFASVGIDDCIDIAKHFFELGIKAKDK